MENYKCLIASKDLIIKKWDQEIENHNYANDWIMFKEESLNNLDTRISSLEKKVKVLENRISRLEVPYQNNLNTNINSNSQTPYQSTQNTGYNGDMYMM